MTPKPPCSRRPVDSQFTMTTYTSGMHYCYISAATSLSQNGRTMCHSVRDTFMITQMPLTLAALTMTGLAIFNFPLISPDEFTLITVYGRKSVKKNNIQDSLPFSFIISHQHRNVGPANFPLPFELT